MSALLWMIYFPLLLTLRILFFWLPPVRSRINFESRNFSEPGCVSHQADYCFEFSSEGEFQQVLPLIEDALKLQKKLELVFFSPSVEKGVRDLYEKHPQLIRYLRYPIATFFPGRTFLDWSTAPKLFLVRYDFFPEFLVWAKKPHHRLTILWATFKKERSKHQAPSVYKKYFMSKASHLVFATDVDLKEANDYSLTGESYDFRMESIRRRCLEREEKFSRVFTDYQQLKNIISKYPREKRLIAGNVWPQDIKLFRNLPSDVLLFIVPHKLDEQNLTDIQNGLEQIHRPASVIKDVWPGESNTYLLDKKGVLCELYGDFGKAYVGGGFGVSVHSLLEPLISGSDLISCGPVHHRSTEFDVAHSLGHMTSVKNEEEFSQWTLLDLPKNQTSDKLKLVFQRYPEISKDVLSC